MQLFARKNRLLRMTPTFYVIPPLTKNKKFIIPNGLAKYLFQHLVRADVAKPFNMQHIIFK